MRINHLSHLKIDSAMQSICIVLKATISIICIAHGVDMQFTFLNNGLIQYVGSVDVVNSLSIPRQIQTIVISWFSSTDSSHCNSLLKRHT